MFASPKIISQSKESFNSAQKLDSLSLPSLLIVVLKAKGIFVLSESLIVFQYFHYSFGTDCITLGCYYKIQTDYLCYCFHKDYYSLLNEVSLFKLPPYPHRRTCAWYANPPIDVMGNSKILFYKDYSIFMLGFRILHISTIFSLYGLQGLFDMSLRVFSCFGFHYRSHFLSCYFIAIIFTILFILIWH